MKRRWYSAALVPALLLTLLLTLLPVPQAAAAAAKLPTPEVEWLTQDTEIDGRQFKAGELILKNIPQDIMPDYEVVIKNADTGEVFETYEDGFGGGMTSAQKLVVGWYAEGSMATVSYTATVTYLGDNGETYTDSDPATTAAYAYTNPGASYGIPTEIHWNGANFAYTIEDAVLTEHAILFIQFAKVQEDGSYSSIGYKGTSAQEAQDTNNQIFLERFNERVARYGPGDYVFRLRVTSPDITQKWHSGWSEWSEPRTVSGTSGEIDSSLEDILQDLPETGSSTEQKQAAVDAVRALDQEKLRESLSADQDGTGVAQTLKELEERLGLTAQVQVDSAYQVDVDTKLVTVAGAGLNAKDLSTPPTLTFSNPPRELEIPNTYRNYVQMDLSLGDTVETNPDGTLLVPIQITMPVPDGIDHAKLQILHFHEDGSMERITPYCFQNGAQWMARFTVNQLSPFVFGVYEPFTVTFDPMGGTVTPTSQQTDENGKLASLPVPTKTDNEFDGWFTQTEGGTQINNAYVFTADTTLYAHWTVQQPGGGGSSGGSGSGGGSSAPQYAAAVEPADNGSVKLSASNAAKGTTVTVTVTPDKGYELASLTVTDQNGNAVTLTEQANGTFTFVMPGSKVTVKAVFQPVEETVQPLPFEDVPETAWYADAVRYVYENGIMGGYSADRFGPEDLLSRAQLTQLLYNLAGNPVQNEEPGKGFTDVPESAWYADSVYWAQRNGIVNGYSQDTFGPEDPVTREQLVTMLSRYVQFQGGDVTGSGNLSAYTDGNAVSEYARSAMAWACGQGLINGANGALNPQGTATRAEVAQLMTNYLRQN